MGTNSSKQPQQATRVFWKWAVVLLLAPLAGLQAHELSRLETQKQQLGKLQMLVGSWRGVAQPQRGSTKGAWTEQTEWAWRFDGDDAALTAKIEKSKVFRSLELHAGNEGDEFVLSAVPAMGDAVVRYVGQLDADGKLTLDRQATKTADDAAASLADIPTRITLRTVAGGDRLLTLYEKAGAGDKLVRLAEVGYTRKGSGFGQGSSGPECLVTGGYGSIEVTHNGKMYFVCCTGCLDYFKEKPDEVLAAYAERKADEKAKQK